jgi:4-amino-4-deoxy-L-arabinose transferase-like glycosyltransferase
MPPSSRWFRAALCALVAALVYLPGLGRPALWEPDEGRYAEIAREMVVTGDYVTPRVDELRYFEKPPLVYWAEAAAIHVFGANEFAVRLPAALFTAGEVGVTCAIADAMFGAEVGILAALALALSPLVFSFARFATLDPALAFFVSAALGAFYAAAHAADFGSKAAWRWMWLAAAALALGTLAKGPVALALGGGVALAWLLVERRTRDLARIPFVSCIAIYLAIAVPWFAFAEARNPGFLGFFFVHEHLQRYLASREHGWGPYFFIPIVVGGAWPWLYFAPLAVAELRRAHGRERAALLPAFNFLAIWFVLIFIFFSIPRSKLGSYILPAMPALAIAAAYGLWQLPSIGFARRSAWLRGFAAANVAVAVVGAVLAGWFVHPRDAVLAYDAWVIAAALAAGAVGAWLLGRGERGAVPAAGAIALAMVVAIGFGERARSDVSAQVSYRSLARTISPYLAPGCVLASYRHYVQALPFYTGVRETPVEYQGELAEFDPASTTPGAYIGTESKLLEIWSSGRCVVLVANRKDVTALARKLTPAPVTIACEGKKVALFNGRSRSAPPENGCAGAN